MRLRELFKWYGLASIISVALLATLFLLPSPVAALSLLWSVPLFLRLRSRVRHDLIEQVEIARRQELGAADVKMSSLYSEIDDLRKAIDDVRQANEDSRKTIDDLRKANATLESDLRYAWRLLEVAEERFVSRRDAE